MLSTLQNGYSTVKSNWRYIAAGFAAFQTIKFIRRVFIRGGPGPMGLPIFGNTPIEIVNTPHRHEVYFKYNEKYGSYCVLEGVFVYNHLISDPAVIEEVLKDTETFAEREYVTGFDYFTPHGLLSLNTGEQWKQHRATFSPLFTDEFLTHYAQAMVGITNTLLQQWGQNKGTSDLRTDMNNLTLDILGQTILGYNFDNLTTANPVITNKKMQPYVLTIAAIGLIPKFLWNFLLIPKGAKQFNDDLVTLCRSLMAQADKGSLDPKCFLSILSKAKGPDGTKWSDSEIMSEVQHFLLAGHETTSNTLCFALHCLANYPEIQDRARAEVLRVVGSSATLPYDKVKSLDYIWAVFREALRLFPTVPVNARYCRKSTQVAGHFVKAGDMVLINTYHGNRNPKYFENPNVFIPERWLDETGKRSAKIQDPFKFARNFGGGVRRCIGQRFAEEEGIIILSMILQKFKVFPVSHTSNELKTGFGVTIFVEDAMKIRCEPI